MFLTIGEKVKKSRRKYKIKQVAFEPYGITQYYLSLIENGKRNSSEEVVTCIFDAFVELTNNKILEEYTKEEFIKTKQEQLVEYIEVQLEQSKELINYEQLIELAKTQEATKSLYDIYMNLGYFEREKMNFKISNDAFKDAVYYGNMNSFNLDEAYSLMGLNLVDMGNYEGAIGYFITLLNQAEPNTEQYFKLKHRVAGLESMINNHEKSLVYVEEIISECPYKHIVIGSIILRERLLRFFGRYDEAIEVLLTHISDKDFEVYLFYIYQNLAHNYRAIAEYDKAIYYTKEAMKHPVEVTFCVEHMIALLAEIYTDSEKYTEALECLDGIKHIVTIDQDYTLAELVYTAYLKIYIIQNNQEAILQLLTDLKELRDADRIKKDFYYKQKTKALQYILEVNNIVSE